MRALTATLLSAAAVNGGVSAQGSGVIVTEVGAGAEIDSTPVWSDYSLAEPSWARAGTQAFSLSDKGDFTNKMWGIGDYATQGSLIAEKLVSLGGSAE